MAPVLAVPRGWHAKLLICPALLSLPFVRGYAVSRGATRSINAYKQLRKTPELFQEGWPAAWFDERYLQFRHSLANGSVDAFFELAREEGPGIYSFPLFSKAFCNLFLDEVDNYKKSGLPIRRPNSM